jgi:hypothetical protein
LFEICRMTSVSRPEMSGGDGIHAIYN